MANKENKEENTKEIIIDLPLYEEISSVIPYQKPNGEWYYRAYNRHGQLLSVGNGYPVAWSKNRVTVQTSNNHAAEKGVNGADSRFH